VEDNQAGPSEHQPPLSDQFNSNSDQNGASEQQENAPPLSGSEQQDQGSGPGDETSGAGPGDETTSPTGALQGGVEDNQAGPSEHQPPLGDQFNSNSDQNGTSEQQENAPPLSGSEEQDQGSGPGDETTSPTGALQGGVEDNQAGPSENQPPLSGSEQQDQGSGPGDETTSPTGALQGGVEDNQAGPSEHQPPLGDQFNSNSDQNGTSEQQENAPPLSGSEEQDQGSGPGDETTSPTGALQGGVEDKQEGSSENQPPLGDQFNSNSDQNGTSEQQENAPPLSGSEEQDQGSGPGDETSGAGPGDQTSPPGALQGGVQENQQGSSGDQTPPGDQFNANTDQNNPPDDGTIPPPATWALAPQAAPQFASPPPQDNGSGPGNGVNAPPPAPPQPAPRVLHGQVTDNDYQGSGGNQPDQSAPPDYTAQNDQTPQQQQDFQTRMLLGAQDLLQAAGRIAKANTDAMDVTKHNDVGIGVALGAYLGALGPMLKLTGAQFQLLAATRMSAPSAQVLETIAADASQEAGAVSQQVEKTVDALKAEPATYGNGNAGGVGSHFGGEFYNDNVTPVLNQPSLPAQGELPVCGVLSCARLGELLGVQKTLQEVYGHAPWLSDIIRNSGMSVSQIQSTLHNMGITAQVGEDLKDMVKLVNSGKPVIAGVRNFVQTGPVPAGMQAIQPGLHAVVVEGVRLQPGNQLEVLIYDPVGTFYWQNVKNFASFFTQYVRPP
jgi:hypothetical protein